MHIIRNPFVEVSYRLADNSKNNCNKAVEVEVSVWNGHNAMDIILKRITLLPVPWVQWSVKTSMTCCWLDETVNFLQRVDAFWIYHSKETEKFLPLWSQSYLFFATSLAGIYVVLA